MLLNNNHNSTQATLKGGFFVYNYHPLFQLFLIKTIEMEKNKHRLSQPARKEVDRIDSQGELVDSWSSVRFMCAELNYDRRAVLRVLKKEPRFKSVKGYTFKYKEGKK